MLLEELLRCQIQEWYPLFRRHTIPTVLLPLPAPFLRYLAGQPAYPNPNSDNEPSSPLPFFLPTITSGRGPFILAHNLPDPVSLLDDNIAFFDSDVDSDDVEGGGGSNGNPLRPAFPELEASVDAAIAELGGAAFPKLNWSAPKDATFMTADGSLSCSCFAEVCMLLRASDCVAHDLVYARPSCDDFVRAGVVRRNAKDGVCDGEEAARRNTQQSGADKGIRTNAQEIGDDKRDEGVRQNDQESGVEEDDEGARPNAQDSSNDGGALSNAHQTGEEGSLQGAANTDDNDATESGQESNEEVWVDDGFQYYLALRKWYPGLRPESEFRCFVRGRQLVCLSQRDPSAYYPSLPGWCAEMRPRIEAFFTEVVEPRFGLENYTFDVYVRADGVVKLIDFNPWGGYTLPLLFTWEDLEEKSRGEEVECRVVLQQGAVRPGLMTAVPYDMLDWGEGSGWDVFMKKTEDEIRRQLNNLGGES